MLLSNDYALYIHLPFCASKCRYCDFYSEVKDSNFIKQYLDVLLLELDHVSVKYSLNNMCARTLFFGGGTPSLLSAEQYSYLCNELKKRISFSNISEWTIECNPDSFSSELAQSLLSHGVNRISVGIQSLNDRELRLLGRCHSAERARNVLNNPVLGGFNSVSADLMFGIPCQTIKSFSESLDIVLNSRHIKHLSIYELTINENTPFGRHYKRLSLPDEDTMDKMSNIVLSRTKQAGFEHYEVSNYALPYFHCRHNEAYWEHRNYIGLGAAAHSYMHSLRWGNITDAAEYIQRCCNGKSVTQFTETIDNKKLACEMLFLGLRKASGINEVTFEEHTGQPFRTIANSKQLDLFLDQNYLIYNPPFWKPTEKGLLFADAMAEKLSV